MTRKNLATLGFLLLFVVSSAFAQQIGTLTASSPAVSLIEHQRTNITGTLSYTSPYSAS